jgi:flagellar biosynthesis/type III secretory pathway protein FliH
MEKHLAGPTKKFLFDINDFDEAALRAKEVAARRPTFSQEEMEASRQTGHAQGKLEGLKEAIDSQESQIRDLCQQIVIATDKLAQEESDRMATFIDQSALIAVQALSKALPALLETLAIDQIASFVNNVLEEHSKHQTLNIFVAPVREDAVKKRLEAMAASMHRQQNWTIAGDAGLSDLQCRIEWTAGGAEWDPRTVSDALLAAIISHLPPHLRSQAEVQPDAIDDTAQKPHTDSTPSGEAP